MYGQTVSPADGSNILNGLYYLNEWNKFTAIASLRSFAAVSL